MNDYRLIISILDEINFVFVSCRCVAVLLVFCFVLNMYMGIRNNRLQLPPVDTVTDRRMERQRDIVCVCVVVIEIEYALAHTRANRHAHMHANAGTLTHTHKRARALRHTRIHTDTRTTTNASLAME